MEKENKLATLGEVAQALSGEFAVVENDTVIFQGTAEAFLCNGPVVALESPIVEIYVTETVLHIKIQRQGVK